MLSNFQLGNQSLLQSFLVGQPEFRVILQSPEMEQFRQRVAATCHIGPLDMEETQHYIEHRLKCAGYAGKPTFEAEAFKAIFRASHGIPRRVRRRDMASASPGASPMRVGSTAASPDAAATAPSSSSAVTSLGGTWDSWANSRTTSFTSSTVKCILPAR